MGYGLRQTVAPSVEPLTPEEVKEWLRVQHDKENTLLTELIKDARERFERIAGIQLIQATYQLTLDGLPGEERNLDCGVEDGERIYPPMPRLMAVSSIQYVDDDGATQTWASTNYRVDTSSEPGRIELAYDASWPTTREVSNAVTITYTAGFGTTATSVPASIKLALRRIIGLLYGNRGIDKDTEMLERAIECLCQPFWHGHIY